MDYRKEAFELFLSFVVKNNDRSETILWILINALNFKLFDSKNNSNQTGVFVFYQQFLDSEIQNKSKELLQSESLTILRLFIHILLSNDANYHCFLPLLPLIIGNIFPTLIPLLSSEDQQRFKDYFILSECNTELIKLFLSFFLVNSIRFSVLSKLTNFSEVFIGIVNCVMKNKWSFQECHTILRPAIRWYFSLLFWQDTKILKSTMTQPTLELIQQSFLMNIQEIIETNDFSCTIKETGKTVINDIIQLVASIYPNVFDNSLLVLKSAERIMYNYLTKLSQQVERVKKIQSQTTRQLIFGVIVLYIRFCLKDDKKWVFGDDALITRLSSFYDVNGVIEALVEGYGHVIHIVIAKTSRTKNNKKNLVTLKSLLSPNYESRINAIPTVPIPLIQEEFPNPPPIICYQSMLLKPFTEQWQEEELSYYLTLFTQTFKEYGNKVGSKYYRNVNVMLCQSCLILLQTTKSIQEQLHFNELFFEHIFSLLQSPDSFISAFCIAPIFQLFNNFHKTKELISVIADIIERANEKQIILILDNIIPLLSIEHKGDVLIIWSLVDKLTKVFENEINGVTCFSNPCMDKKLTDDLIPIDEKILYPSINCFSRISDLLHIILSLLSNWAYKPDNEKIQKLQQCYIKAIKLNCSICNHIEIIWACCSLLVFIEEIYLNNGQSQKEKTIQRNQQEVFECILDDCFEKNKEKTNDLLLNISLVLEHISKISCNITNETLDYIICSLLTKSVQSDSIPLKIRTMMMLCIQKIVIFNGQIMDKTSSCTFDTLINFVTQQREQISLLTENTELEVAFASDATYSWLKNHKLVQLVEIGKITPLIHIAQLQQIVSIYEDNTHKLFLVLRNALGIKMWKLNNLQQPLNRLDDRINEIKQYIDIDYHQEPVENTNSVESDIPEFENSLDLAIENDIDDYDLNERFSCGSHYYRFTENYFHFKSEETFERYYKTKDGINLNQFLTTQPQIEYKKEGYEIRKDVVDILTMLFGFDWEKDCFINVLDHEDIVDNIKQLDSIKLKERFEVGIVYVSDPSITLQKFTKTPNKPNDDYYIFTNLLGKRNSEKKEIIEYTREYQTLNYIDNYELLKSQPNSDLVLKTNVLIMYTTFMGFNPTPFLDDTVKNVIVLTPYNALYHISLWHFKKTGFGILQNGMLISPNRFSSLLSSTIISLQHGYGISENLLIKREKTLFNICSLRKPINLRCVGCVN